MVDSYCYLEEQELWNQEFHFREVLEVPGFSRFLEVSQSFSKFLEVSRGFSKFLKVSQSFSMFFKVSQSFSKFLEVSRGFSMFLNVSQSFSKFLDVTGNSPALEWLYPAYIIVTVVLLECFDL